MKPIVLVGLPGAGKTTIGAALAARLELDFIDIDEVIEQRTKSTVPKLFEHIGEEGFRKIEREVTIDFVERKNLVIALGGGGFQDESTRSLLLQHCTTIWLDPPHEVLLERLRKAPPRPLFRNRNHARLLVELLAIRRAAFAQAHIRVTDPRLGAAIAKITRKVASLMEGPCAPLS